ncbi:MAG TPA: AmmeMemoRadiSam system radical SAM enzyme, partial [Candidatus Limnocylindrales bacterium]|nr:AmmeMemoRadiSam system radical SAM enzyme [Candidatus Limnocylindrales bacterium]
VAVTAGYVKNDARLELFGAMDAANVDLKALDDGFYRRFAIGRLAPVLETLEGVATLGRTWLEVTTLVIPGLNDGDAELDALTRWLADHLGPDVPLHVTAFHPDFRMLDRPPTPTATLTRARAIGLANGLRYVYTGNVHDPDGQATRCHECGHVLVGRDGYAISAWGLDGGGRCADCGERLPGEFEAQPGRWGSRRQPVRIDG